MNNTESDDENIFGLMNMDMEKIKQISEVLKLIKKENNKCPDKLRINQLKRLAACLFSSLNNIKEHNGQ